MDVDMSDLRRFERDLDEFEKNVTGQVVSIVEASLEGGEAISAALVPVDTGHLASTLDSSEVSVVGGVVWGEWGASAEYADYVERGTRHSENDYAEGLESHQINWRTRAQPYITPAFEAVEPAFYAAVERVELW